MGELGTFLIVMLIAWCAVNAIRRAINPKQYEEEVQRMKQTRDAMWGVGMDMLWRAFKK